MILPADQIDLGQARFQETKAFLAYWLSLSNYGDIPSSRAFFEHPHPDLLPRCYIFEMADHHTLICRFMGTKQVEIWDVDFTDKDLTREFPTESQIIRVHTNYCNLVNHPCGMLDCVNYSSRSGLIFPQEQFAVPLAVGSGKIPRVLMFGMAGESVGLTSPLAQLADVEGRSWIDIGFGVPDSPVIRP